MAIKSTFARGGDGMTSGGLDRFLAPPAGDYSNLPESIEEPAPVVEPEIPVDCDGKDRDQPVCQIAAAEQAKAKQ
jgi:hypothetical protein